MTSVKSPEMGVEEIGSSPSLDIILLTHLSEPECALRHPVATCGDGQSPYNRWGWCSSQGMVDLYLELF